MLCVGRKSVENNGVYELEETQVPCIHVLDTKQVDVSRDYWRLWELYVESTGP